MDPVEIMLHENRVVPYYRPVISAETQLVVGYEIEAFFHEEDGTVQSIDWFFKDLSIPDEFRLELSRLLLEKAIEYQMKTDPSMYIFFNYDTNLLMKDRGECLEKFLDIYTKKGFDINKLIIQLKEEFKTEEMDSVRILFNYLKSIGIRIALDDIGERSGSFDRLAYLKPSVVKIDVGFLKDNDSPHLYRDVHHSLSLLSQKIGATLMFKNISTYHQLNHAWRNGGRFYQGNYLIRSGQEYVPIDCCQEKMKKDFQLFVNYERKKIKAQMTLTNAINQQLKSILTSIHSDDPLDETILKIGKACSDYAFRVYICNEEGLQLSANAEKDNDGNWSLKEEIRNKNWSWRPYFFENIARMNIEKKGILSDLYTDIEKNEQIRTFSYPISDTLYVFLDIPYAYLYEQEGLL